MSRRAQNTVMILSALGGVLVTLHSQTNWLSANAAHPVERERCYGVAREAGNDCATPKHSCAAQSTHARDPEEWIMLPKGLCDRISGSRTGQL